MLLFPVYVVRFIFFKIQKFKPPADTSNFFKEADICIVD